MGVLTAVCLGAMETIALGQLVFFGYKALESRRFALAAISLAAYAIVDAAAIYLLKEVQSASATN